MRPRLVAVPIVTHRAAARPRSYVAVRGPDAPDLLQRLLSNDVEQDADVFPALLLTAKGRIVAPLRVWRRGADDFLLLTEPELGDVVRSVLVRARFAANCEIEPEEHTSTLVFGVADGLPGELPGTAEVLDGDFDATLDEDELERARIERLVPAWGKELDESIIPAEAGLDRTHISFTKGCYPGQEPIARLHYRGHANRELRVLEVDAVQPGDEVRFGDKAVGRVTSAVDGLALAYVRSEVPDGAEVDVAGRRAKSRPRPS
jgi:folate-binding protein YgfZ